MKLFNPLIANGRQLSATDRALVVSPAHDKPGRSAALLWESLFEVPGIFIPKAINDFLINHPDFYNSTYKEIIPEHHTAFDNLGKGRMHDLLIELEFNDLKTVIAIEAKVDEPFDSRTVKEYLDEGISIIDAGKNSSRPQRVTKLLKAMFAPSLHASALSVKYQLLQATAGTLTEAKLRGADRAVFCILNFKPDNPSAQFTAKSQLNRQHLADYCSLFAGESVVLGGNNNFIGPFTVPGDADIPGNIPLYFLCLEQQFQTTV